MWRPGSFAVLTVVLSTALLGCSPLPQHVDGAQTSPQEPLGPPAIHVDRATTVISDPIRLTVTGLRPGQEVTITAQTTDVSGYVWKSSATFRADRNGDVDPSSMKPTAGSYAVTDGMGLFRSMKTSGVQPLPTGPVPAGLAEVDNLVLSADGHSLTTASVTRLFMADGVTATAFRPPQDEFYGDFFAPAPTSKLKPGILVFGGSEGGLSQDLEAAQLASNGYPALALAYFAEPGLPSELRGVPLEYFAGALDWLRRQPGVDPAHLVVEGVSRGGEAALLLGAHFPNLVHAIVALVPSAWVHGSNPTPGFAAWTLEGKDVAFSNDNSDAQALIPVARINGPLFMDCGGDDAVWPSCTSTDEVAKELPRDFAFSVTSLRYPDGGHGVGAVVPYISSYETFATLGRTADANPIARERTWPRLLAFLSALQS